MVKMFIKQLTLILCFTMTKGGVKEVYRGKIY